MEEKNSLLRYYMKMYHISQTELAKFMGRNRSKLSKMINEELSAETENKLLKATEELGKCKTQSLQND